MIIKLGERLKTLRKSKDLTQDELAECLGVSYQAISRWERSEGYPDISTLPLIANFFNTTIDDLLGVNQEKTREKIYEYLFQGANYYNKKDTANSIKVLREALSEFPNSDDIILALVKTLFLHSQLEEVTTGTATNNNDEIVLLCKKILSYSLNDSIRAKALDILASHYLYNMKDYSKAKEIADTMPRFDYSRTFIPAHCIRDNSEKQVVFQEMIMNHAYVVSGAIRCYMESNSNLSIETRIDLFQRCNKMFEILFDAEYNYDILFVINLSLAELYMKTGKQETAMDMLMSCCQYAEKWDEIKTLPHTETYKTPLLNLIPKHIKAIDAFEKNEHRDFSFRSVFLSELERLNDVFAPLHDNDKYKKMVAQLVI